MSSPLAPVEVSSMRLTGSGGQRAFAVAATCIYSTISAQDQGGHNFGTSGAVIESETAIHAPGKSRSRNGHVQGGRNHLCDVLRLCLQVLSFS